MRLGLTLPILVFLLAACGSTPATLSEVESGVFVNSCVFSSCHMGASPAGELNLESPTWAKLVDVASVQDPARKRVVAFDPDASYLFHKLEGTNLPSGTEQMPPTAALSDTRLEMIRSWIENGALDD